MTAFKCTCGSNFASLSDLQQHAKDKNKKTSLRCSCRQLFRNRNKLVEHAQKHGHSITHEEEGGKPLATEELKQRDHQCPHCPKKKPFDSEEALRQHTEAVHSDTVPRNAKMQPHQCPLCENKYFRNGKDVTAHLRDVHAFSSSNLETQAVSRTHGMTTMNGARAEAARKKPHSCDTCGRRFVKAESLEQHQSSAHSQASTAIPDAFDALDAAFPSFATPAGSSVIGTAPASASSASNATGKEAVEDDAAARPFPCPVCGYRFAKAELVAQHLICRHSEPVGAIAADVHAAPSSPDAPAFPYRTLKTAKAAVASTAQGASPEAVTPSKTLKTSAKKNKCLGATKKKPHVCVPCSRRFKEAADLQRHNDSTHLEAHSANEADTEASSSSASAATSSADGGVAVLWELPTDDLDEKVNAELEAILDEEDEAHYMGQKALQKAKGSKGDTMGDWE